MLIDSSSSVITTAAVALPLKEEVRRTLVSLQCVAAAVAFRIIVALAVVSIREHASILCHEEPLPLHGCPLVREDFVGSWICCGVLYGALFQGTYTGGTRRGAVHKTTIQDGSRPDFKFELFPLHSPLLRESCLVSFPPLIDMLKFSG